MVHMEASSSYERNGTNAVTTNGRRSALSSALERGCLPARGSLVPERAGTLQACLRSSVWSEAPEVHMEASSSYERNGANAVTTNGRRSALSSALERGCLQSNSVVKKQTGHGPGGTVVAFLI